MMRNGSSDVDKKISDCSSDGNNGDADDDTAAWLA